MTKWISGFLIIAASSFAAQTNDIVVYGGTSAGVIAAVQAVKMGKSVILVAPEKHLGGLSSGGLGYTDIGNKDAIGGLSREFYQRVWKKYADDAAWKFEQRHPYGGQGVNVEPGEETMWIFEPHVAEQVFEDYIAENKIELVRGERLDLKNGVVKDGARIVSFKTESGKVFAGRQFIDATYEGDLMAKAGVTYTVGREANAQYGEMFNGVETKHAKGHQFPGNISAYKIENDPYSGFLPRIAASPPDADGTADRRVQAYCFRMCLSDEPANRIPFAKPEGYDASQYELILRVLKTGWRQVFNKFDRIPNRKTDTNNHGPFSTDNIGMNYDYPDGDYATREKIIAEHRTYEAGWFYFLANDERVPEDVRTKMSQWGLPKDEFTDNGNWPHQLYVREARRMIGEAVMTEHHCTGRETVPDSVGLAAYGMDSHNTMRYADDKGFVHNEGNIQVGVAGPYPISYRSLTPKKSECENLLVPVCLSASHIAYGSIRMEPVFMILAQSAATAAALALDKKSAVQDVNYRELNSRLLADKQTLAWTGKKKTHQPAAAKLDGIVIDDDTALLSGEWKEGNLHGAVGGYRHDANEGKGQKTARYSTKLPKDGTYEIRLHYPANPNRATNVPVTIITADGEQRVTVNERDATTPYAKLGVFKFAADKTAVVTISNAGTDGFVVIDAIQFLPAN